MTAHNQNSAFHATLKPSKKLRYWLIVSHSLAIGAVLTSALVWQIKLAVASTVAVNFIYVTRKFKVESREINYSAHGGWEITDLGKPRTVRIRKSSIITPKVVFLHIEGEPSIVIFHDAMDEPDFRHFIVKLKLTVT